MYILYYVLCVGQKEFDEQTLSAGRLARIPGIRGSTGSIVFEPTQSALTYIYYNTEFRILPTIFHLKFE